MDIDLIKGIFYEQPKLTLELLHTAGKVFPDVAVRIVSELLHRGRPPDRVTPIVGQDHKRIEGLRQRGRGTSRPQNTRRQRTHITRRLNHDIT